MKDLELEKAKKFVNDTVMKEAVYKMLLNSFLNNKPGNDVYILAASRLAIDFLKTGFKELEQLKNIKEEQSTPPQNVGL